MQLSSLEGLCANPISSYCLNWPAPKKVWTPLIYSFPCMCSGELLTEEFCGPPDGCRGAGGDKGGEAPVRPQSSESEKESKGRQKGARIKSDSISAASFRRTSRTPACCFSCCSLFLTHLNYPGAGTICRATQPTSRCAMFVSPRRRRGLSLQLPTRSTISFLAQTFSNLLKQQTFLAFFFIFVEALMLRLIADLMTDTRFMDG